MKITRAAIFLLLGQAFAAAQFQGTTTAYGKEQCFVLNRFPADSGANYHSKDDDKEKALCSIDFNSDGVGLCPKTWSTSPGTEVYDISNSQYKQNVAGFEAQYCPKQRALKGKVAGVEKLAAYKQSVNGQFGQRTSATFAQGSPLYYQFSRYLNTTVDVPVAVIRTMDAQAHLRRVASRGPALAQGTMNRAGWNVVTSAEKTPAGYVPVNDFYFGDVKDGLLYGTMLKGHGDRYGPEFNGNISGKGYSQQYVFLQQTPAFLALSAQKPFADAATFGVASGRKDPVVAKALGANVSNEQMMFWMQELSDILILDYIFNQQDRPGNIDYLWEWYYVTADGKVKSDKVDSEAGRSGMGSIAMPDEVKNNPKHFLIQKTQINDNDAGGRRYANFTKQFGLLGKVHHLNPTTYRQLMRLASDFQSKGVLYRYLQSTFYLSPNNLASIAQNTIDAAAILRATCKAGTMEFDLDAEGYLATGTANEAQVACE
jgi:hypothetical protein